MPWSSRFLACLCLTVLLVSPQAQGGETFTQQPEVMPAQADGQEVVEAPQKENKKQPDLNKGPAPHWIWGAEPDARYALRKTFQVKSKQTQAVLQASCDNQMTLYVNGKRIASSGEWQSPVKADVKKHLQVGENELVAEVANQGGPSGFVLKLALSSNGKTQYVVSDQSWQAAPSRDAKNWASVKPLAKLGGGPWGNVFSGAAVASGVSPRGVFNVLPGFQVERLFTVPKNELGSWVCIGLDDKGRILASDQGGKGICRITPPPIGSEQPTKVERLDIKMSAAQGMLHAFGSLYFSVNGGPGSGFYRARDTNGDDQYDEVIKLKSFRGGGEHGPHALRLSPDGKSIYVIAGNHTNPPEKFDHSRVPANWDEDLLLPRQWDARGHARGKLAPGGWIAKTDPEGKTWEIVSSGYRNPYDMDFNADGELFAYDADMEWDMGAPWYRPTRVVHATSGSEFGWRSGTGKWATYYVDSLPQLVDIGPGSPVGVTFGYGAKFPAKYQHALYLCDWTFGTIYAIHIEPDGASYQATKQEFVSRTPLPLTDAVVGTDGALYFTVGGRGTQSELFRVTYVGDAPTSPADAHDAKFADLRKLRQQIEAYHRPASDPAAAVNFVWPHLSHQDRHIRYAARVALEHQPAKLWQKRVLAESNPEGLITGAVALARQGDPALQSELLAALDKLDYGKLTDFQQLELLRVYQLVFIRMGAPDDQAKLKLAKKFDPHYPAESDSHNRELVKLLVYLESPQVVKKTMKLIDAPRKQQESDLGELLTRNRGYGGTIAQMLANQPDKQKLHYAFVLRNAKKGWTVEDRKRYFTFLNDDARQWKGGASFQGFLKNIDQEAWANASDTERLAVEALGARKPYVVPPLPKPKGPGHKWTVDEVLKLGETKLTGRNFKNGEKMYKATRCVVCHRFAGDGGATGPDLTQLAGRFNLKDLTEALIEPSKVISDQYKASVVVTASGKVHTGRIVSETDKTLTIVVDPEDATKTVEVAAGDVEEVQTSKVSLMPKDLLSTLNEDEVLDLLAYLLSRGNPRDPMFRK